MLKFLINRPIAVTMTFIAIACLGLVSITQIPVSLMPDIAIPEITVQVEEEDMPARELENSVIRILRQQLIQVSHLDDLKSEVTDGRAIIKLKFNYGTNIDFSFIEVNEKVDRSMNSLPKDLDRPKVIKASIGDIPVFYLNLTLNQNDNSKSERKIVKYPNSDSLINTNLYTVDQRFVELSRFSKNVIKRRMEQLAEVAMVDVSGTVESEILVLPNQQKMKALNIQLDELENAIKRNNFLLGNFSVHEGQYLYNIRFDANIDNIEELNNIYLRTEDRIYQIKDIAEVIEHPKQPRGWVTSNDKQSITMAVIKQSDAQVNQLKKSLHQIVEQFEDDYPDVKFEITRDQTKLLNYSISNLIQSLLIGILLSFCVMFFFLKDLTSPILIGISIPVSLIISLLFFYIFNISINVISLSGLVLGVGMMIDNSIIVIDNISQNYSRNLKTNNYFNNFETKLQDTSSASSSIAMMNDKLRMNLLFNSCVNGTKEVIRPLLSSALTTCAVFIPMIFLKGIAGSLFYDQAMAVTIGLLVSLAVSITLLPVYYFFMYRWKKFKGNRQVSVRAYSFKYEKLYENGFRQVMRNQGWVWLLVLLFLSGTIVFYKVLPISKLPSIEQTELLIEINWNSPVTVKESQNQISGFQSILNPFTIQTTALIGVQQFLIEKNNLRNQSEVMLYVKAKSTSHLDSIKQLTKKYFSNPKLSQAHFQFKDAENIFNVLFADNQSFIEARIRALDDLGPNYAQRLEFVVTSIDSTLNNNISPILWNENIVLRILPEKLMLYDLDYFTLYKYLKSEFNKNQVFKIVDNNEYIPIIIGNDTQSINKLLETGMVLNKNNKMIPINELIVKTTQRDINNIIAGKEGEYFPIEIITTSPNKVIDTINQLLVTNPEFEVSYSGKYFSNKAMLKQLIFILLISILLLYFILASQFESTVLPIIILLEIPIDIFGALLLLWVLGEGINLMSLIGLIVMSGIIINDSILKIDTINQLRNEGYGLIRAISTAGQRRLKPILMTSITTILALTPFLFVHGIGADLQRPLAIAIIGGMCIGTMVSLYFIPLCYYSLNILLRKK